MPEKTGFKRVRTALVVFTLFAIAGFFVFKTLVPTLQRVFGKQAAPAVIYVPGIVRDFRLDHPDFDVVPPAGYGHYAGNMVLELGADQRPVFEGDGFHVTAQWRDKISRPIPPHLYGGVPPIQLASSPLMQSGTTLDSWEPEDGRYGEDGNIGPAPDIFVGAVMPTITPPEDLGPSEGNVVLNPGSDTISASFRCSDLTIKSSSVLSIDGDITIRVDDSFTMQQNAQLVLLPDSRLSLYVGNSFATYHTTELNMNTLDPLRVLIYYYGTGQMDISQYSKICASVVAPQGCLELGQDTEFYGTYYGECIDMRQGSQFHSSGSEVFNGCGDEIDDRYGVYGTYTPGGITSEATFNQWYHDVLGENLSQVHTIQLHRDATGIYETRLSDFFPIDHRLYGNESMPHNYFFTYSFSAAFTYQSCAGQFFEFTGADDAWMFIDGDLALDLGGVKPGVSQIVELERLGLTDGESYAIGFFYAQRNPDRSFFNLRTNVELIPQTLVGAGTASYD